MSDTNLSERVCDLEERVAYLEEELDISVDEKRFERQIKRICVSEEKYDVDTDGMGRYTADVYIHPNDLPYATTRIDEMEGLGWEVSESSEDEIVLRVEQGLVNK